MNKYLSNILRFILVTAAQLFILDNVYLVGFIVPVIYIYFILKLPVGTKRLVVLFLSFLIGLTIDLFTGTYGVHAAASTFIGFSRRFFMRLSLGDIDDDRETAPSVREDGFYSFLGYTSILTLIHTFLFLWLENFSLEPFPRYLFRILASAAFSIFLIMLIEILMQPSQKRKR